MFEHYNHLGFHNPYYILENDNIILASSFEEALKLKKDKEHILDFTALTEVFCSGFCFGDRTLVKGIYKTPWMAKPSKDFKNWEYFELPNHQEIIQKNDEIALRLISLLEEEIIKYISNHENIGILLTGGMDSRIVAAILKNLINKGVFSNKLIYTYTWGFEDSRDVVYAKRISDMFGWKWKHLEVTVDQMKENCEIAINNGCEFTPIHLHAMSQLKNEKHLDCVLAGSFGDSVGRAEFSGTKVTNLKGLTDKIQNYGNFLRKDFKELTIKEINEDLDIYHKLFPQEKRYQLYEQDQQLHYMRRMLNSCMSIINKDIPLYQMFSAPKVFGYMWSLSPEVRNDNVYKEILKIIAPELLEIPWARTGIIYPNKKGEADNFKKRHHNYGKMISHHFNSYINSSLKNKNSEILFNKININIFLILIKYFPIKNKNAYEEKLLYIAQVINFLDKYEVKIDINQNTSHTADYKTYFKYILSYIKYKFKK